MVRLPSHRARFTRSIPAVANGIVGALKGLAPKLKFRFTGPRRTDGMTIYTGEIPKNADQRMIDMFWGRALHEIGHILFSNFKTIETLSQVWSPLQSGTFMAIEDVYMEGAVIRALPGGRHWLNGSIELMLELDHVKEGTGSRTEALQTFPLFWGNYCFNGYPCLRQRYEATRAKLAEALGETGVTRLEGLLEIEMPQVACSADSAELMQAYLALASEIEEEQDDESQDDDGDDQSQTGSQNQDDDGDDQSQTGSQNQDDDGNNQSQTGSQDQDDDGDDQSQTGSKSSVFANEDDPDLAGHSIDWDAGMDEVSEETRAQNEAAGDNQLASDATVFSGRQEKPCAGDIARYEALRAETSGVVNTMANRLVRLMAVARTPSRKTTTRGRVRINKAPRLFTGDQRIYRHKQYAEVPESVVSIVTDLSGSMAGYCESAASTVLIALGEALNRVAIPFEASCFGADYWVIKDFNEPLGANRPYFGGLSEAVSGTTPLGEAMHESGLRLIKQPQARKIMIVITDGEPDNPALVTDIDRGLNADGIEVLGIGIYSHAVESLVQRSAVVNDLQDLGPVVLNKLTPRLLAKAG